MIKLNPYIAFTGNCEEALNFYAACLNGEIKSLSRYEGSPMEIADNFKQKILHAEFYFGTSLIMACDSPPDQKVIVGSNISLSINMDNLNEMDKMFNKLSAGGKITMPLQDTFWGARFGMLTDKFGINWMFNCELKK